MQKEKGQSIMTIEMAAAIDASEDFLSLEEFDYYLTLDKGNQKISLALETGE